MRRAKILNVDDREVNRYLRTEALRVAEYHIIEASRGRDALELGLSAQPDIVLLDVHLPDMSGLEVCRLLKADRRTASSMVIQISASAVHFTDAVRGLETGADDYLVEPVEPELLVAKVRSMLRLRAAEQALRRRNEDLREFAYAASHDLQEPLRALSSYAQLLDRRYRPQLDAAAGIYLTHLVEGAQRMSRVISDLLEYSQVSIEKDESPAAVDLNQVVANARVLNATSIQELRAEVTSDSLPVISGSEVRLTQLFSNLIGNALKYSRRGVPPRVHVGCDRRGPDWVLSVNDNGVGFPQEQADEIFGAFRRLHGRDVPGTGIGLAICKAVVERVGGRIWAQSTPGQGSRFFFTLPVSAEATEKEVSETDRYRSELS